MILDHLPSGVSGRDLERIKAEILRSTLRAERELSRELLDAIKAGKTGEWRVSSRAERLLNVRQILDNMNSDVSPLVRPLVDAAFGEGGRAALRELAKIGRSGITQPQAVYEQAIAVLADHASGVMSTALDYAQRIVVRTAEVVNNPDLPSKAAAEKASK